MEISRLSIPISDQRFFAHSIRHFSCHPLPVLPTFFSLSLSKSRRRSLIRSSSCSASNRDTLFAGGGGEATVVSAGKKGEEEQCDLKSWMHKHGLPPCKVVLKERPSYDDTHKPIHYVAASEDLQAGDVAFSVPNSLVVTLERVLGNETIASMEKRQEVSKAPKVTLKDLRNARANKRKAGESSSAAAVKKPATLAMDQEATSATVKEHTRASPVGSPISPVGITTSPKATGSSGPTFLSDFAHKDMSQFKWWHYYQPFEGKPEHPVTSLFDQRFPTTHIIKQHLCLQDDKIRANAVGSKGSARQLQQLSLRAAFLSQTLEASLDAQDRELQAWEAKLEEKEMVNESLRKEVSDTAAKYSDTLSELETLKAQLKEEKDKNKKQEEEISTLTSSIKTLSDSMKAAKKTYAAEKATWEEQAEALKVAMGDQHEEGFNRALEQVKCLHPEINIEEAEMFKEIKDGKLVEMED